MTRQRCNKCGASKIWRYDHSTGRDVLVCPVCDVKRPEKDTEPP